LEFWRVGVLESWSFGELDLPSSFWVLGLLRRVPEKPARDGVM